MGLPPSHSVCTLVLAELAHIYATPHVASAKCVVVGTRSATRSIAMLGGVVSEGVCGIIMCVGSICVVCGVCIGCGH